MNPKDFDAFVEEAKNLKSEDALRLVWKKFFSLSQIYFITCGDANTPFIGELNGKMWIFAFTDQKHIKKFIRELGVPEDQSEINATPVKTDDVIEYLEQFVDSDAYGVRFNEGGHGWFVALRNIRAIRDFIKE